MPRPWIFSSALANWLEDPFSRLPEVNEVSDGIPADGRGAAETVAAEEQYAWCTGVDVGRLGVEMVLGLVTGLAHPIKPKKETFEK